MKQIFFMSPVLPSASTARALNQYALAKMRGADPAKKAEIVRKYSVAISRITRKEIPAEAVTPILEKQSDRLISKFLKTAPKAFAGYVEASLGVILAAVTLENLDKIQNVATFIHGASELADKIREFGPLAIAVAIGLISLGLFCHGSYKMMKETSKFGSASMASIMQTRMEVKNLSVPAKID